MSTSKRIVITGVSRGLGRAMARGFAGRGHHVIGCGRTIEAIDELARELGTPHDFAVVDVTDSDQVATWSHNVVKQHGPPDLLLNNAALINDNAYLWEVPTDEFKRLVDVNINGVFHVLRGFVPAMIEAKAGVIVNFSSGWGRSTSPKVAPYCATKWAIEGLTRALADELPPGLAAVPLNPGVINTQMLQRCFGSSASDYPDAEAWAERAVPLLLNLDASCNGEALTVS